MRSLEKTVDCTCGGSSRSTGKNSSWVPLGSLVFLLREFSMQACAGFVQQDCNGQLFLSLAADADVAPGDLVMPLSAQRIFRVVEIRQDFSEGEIRRTQALCWEEPGE